MLRALVDDYMSSPVVRVERDTTLTTVQRTLDRAGVSSLPVVDATGRPVGVVSRTDLLRVGQRDRPDAEPKLPEIPVGEIMTRGVFTVEGGSTIGEAARHMVDRRIHRVYVSIDDKLEGVLSTRDVMRALADARVMHPISSVMSRHVHTVPPDATLGTVANQLKTLGVSGLVVVDNGTPQGVVSKADLLVALERPPETPVSEVMGSWHLAIPASTPIWQAAARAGQLKVRHILATDGDSLAGILTGIDLAGAALLAPGE